MSDEDDKWRKDSKDLEQLLASYEDYTEDGSVDDEKGLLDGAYVDIREKRNYSDEKSNVLRGFLRIFFLVVSIYICLAIYNMTQTEQIGTNGTGLIPSANQQSENNFELSESASLDPFDETNDAGDFATMENQEVVELHDNHEKIEEVDGYAELPKEDVDIFTSKSESDQGQIFKSKARHPSFEEEDEKDDIQKIEKENATSSKPKIKRIAVLAERNTGLSWLANEIDTCFPDLEITMGLARPGHWFQSNTTEIPEPTIVLPLFLNVYHWVENMRISPHYAPNHKEKEWVEFVSQPWFVHRPKDDFDLLESTKDQNSLTCQLDFKYNEIVSCSDLTLTDGKDAPIYELRKDGQPYPSILQLRRDKILNWLSTSDWTNVEFVHPVQYELLTNNGGLLSVVKVIEMKTEVASACSHDELVDIVAPSYIKALNQDYVDWMHMNAVWDVEEKIGYDKTVPQQSYSSLSTSIPSNSRLAVTSPAASPTP